ncbi:MAG: GNAT family N-acetyltransferase [Pseudomonadota bacterium]
MIERLETERLILRRPTRADEAGAVAFYESDRSKFVGGPFKTHIAWSCWAADFGHWDLRGFGSFAVTMKGDDTCLGIVGPYYPATWPEFEIGWLIWPEAEGRGIAYEAARACVDHAFRDLGWETAVSYIDPENARSIALAERLGAVRDDAAPRPDPEDYVFRHPRPERPA